MQRLQLQGLPLLLLLLQRSPWEQWLLQKRRHTGQQQ
jgi:hypothetical protein